MTNLGPSLEDLLSKEADEKSATGQLQQKLDEIELKKKEEEVSNNADAQRLGYINLVGFPISPDALLTITQDDSERLKCLCFFNNGAEIRIGTTEYTNEVQVLADDIHERHHANVSIYLISENSFARAKKLYDTLPKISRLPGGVKINKEDIERFQKEISTFKDLNEKINKVSITDVVAIILATAIKSDASDIHIEAEEQSIIVRLRIDGLLHESAIIEKDKWKKIIARMKVLAKVKINIEDRPQDGRFTIYFDKDKVEVRTSFLPTAFGESVVMRLLHSQSVALSFEDLGLLPQSYKILEAEVKKPNGLILTAGPTGSGKTTTLYAVLNKLNQPDVKIITLEDPVEYKLKGINQSQVDPKKDYTFAKGLRSILRQDPDIVMVGEIRDGETADIAIQASLTGHLVLSTVHTNDAAGVVPRLMDMGIKPFFIVPSINAVIGQRLVRKLCPDCKKPHELTEEEKETLRKILATISPKSGVSVPTTLPAMFGPGEGCPTCRGIGYKGRIGIYEIFTMDDDIKKLTMEGAAAFQILKQAIENGMLTMLQDGVLKCLQGTTDLQEVFRVIGKLDYVEELYDIVISQTIGRGIKISEEELSQAEKLSKDLSKVGEAMQDLPAKELISLIIATALKTKAGDIHIEPTENGVKVRFRIDGILHNIIDLAKEQYLPILSNVKILAGMPTNIKKATWDGRFGIFTGDSKMDSRVSIISGGYGETVVIRLLSSQAASLTVDQLGMRDYTLRPLNESIVKTKGIIITTGPTGSGKTTTLYALLNKLNHPDVKIITVEDPIEYHLEGVMQTQIDTEEGYTFAAAMRSLLRQNPNIMMIGEIRDAETAATAIEASLTGHLVLSTIHTNSAAGAVPRFVGLGVEPQILANSLECSIGQRLVRKLCPNCKQETELDPATAKEVAKIIDGINAEAKTGLPKKIQFYKAVGCDKCGGIGYKGRLGIYEVISNSSEMQKLIQQPDITNNEIEEQAIKDGAVLMLQDGILKAAAGETSVDEVFRVAK
ncbi:MAG: Type II secretion system protein E [Parcubacteria group bacterium ADurb.Bin326]|nr:MAG: Type II secretion system protein E [Parcubacteria group bacterium ADurb.Bin326]